MEINLNIETYTVIVILAVFGISALAKGTFIMMKRTIRLIMGWFEELETGHKPQDFRDMMRKSDKKPTYVYRNGRRIKIYDPYKKGRKGGKKKGAWVEPATKTTNMGT